MPTKKHTTKGRIAGHRGATLLLGSNRVTSWQWRKFMSIEAKIKSKIIKDFAIKKGDTGSPEVQVALLTYRINQLTEHLKDNRKDNHGKRGFLALIQRRRDLLDYLKRKDVDRYQKLIKSLGLRR